ncbi:hypothetical protein CLIB1423_33S00584 [[Candida] railenensis]|uniref:Uncharacterized protein n=1 Tax=[Candida] railenensis TaxID=45579 RepID=A0A9P0QW79_9ASCO|nr:hypothetical protein CLIB1423_33S00584 [[Candida] railenensis]
MLRRAILYVAVAAIANAADTIDPLTDIASYTDAAFLISAMNEYPYLITYYSELFGADWKKTISDAYDEGVYSMISDYAGYYDTYGNDYSDYSYSTKGSTSAAKTSSGSFSSGTSANSSSASSTSSTAGVYSVGVPFVGLFAMLAALL